MSFLKLCCNSFILLTSYFQGLKSTCKLIFTLSAEDLTLIPPSKSWQAYFCLVLATILTILTIPIGSKMSFTLFMGCGYMSVILRFNYEKQGILPSLQHEEIFSLNKYQNILRSGISLLFKKYLNVWLCNKYSDHLEQCEKYSLINPI